MTQSVDRPVQWWLFLGVFLVFFQVVIGGVTRLTDSGLSITEWAVIQGTIPPLNEEEWIEAFEKYKQAAHKQYQTLHADMSLGEFKVIYFWEYFHRLWARLMGFAFLIPFLYFLFKKKLPGWLIKRLGIVVLLAGLAAVFGWIMVKSGLNNDKRTWVSAYKLVIHLGIAASVFGYLFWTWLIAIGVRKPVKVEPSIKRLVWILMLVLIVQILFGGLMAGMRAALIHPHFPIFIEADRILNALSQQTGKLGLEQFIDYEPHLLAKAIVQILHRATAWFLVVLAGLVTWKVVRLSNDEVLKRAVTLFNAVLITQIALGIFTVINSIGRVPLTLGVLHQATGLILLASGLYLLFLVKNGSQTDIERFE